MRVSTETFDSCLVFPSIPQALLEELACASAEKLRVGGLDIVEEPHGFSCGLLGPLDVFLMFPDKDEEEFFEDSILLPVPVPSGHLGKLEGDLVSGEGLSLLTEHLTGELVEQDHRRKPAIFVILPP